MMVKIKLKNKFEGTKKIKLEVWIEKKRTLTKEKWNQTNED
jgi:hypothetical protein